MIPFGAYFEPNAQTDFGIAYLSPAPALDYLVSGVAVVTFGFIVAEFWNYCAADETTTWSAVSDASTTWSECP